MENIVIILTSIFLIGMILLMILDYKSKSKKNNIIYCKECKYHNNGTGECRCKCRRIGGVNSYTANDDHCKYGERW